MVRVRDSGFTKSDSCRPCIKQYRPDLCLIWCPTLFLVIASLITERQADNRELLAAHLGSVSLSGPLNRKNSGWGDGESSRERESGRTAMGDDGRAVLALGACRWLTGRVASPPDTQQNAKRGSDNNKKRARSFCPTIVLPLHSVLSLWFRSIWLCFFSFHAESAFLHCSWFTASKKHPPHMQTTAADVFDLIFHFPLAFVLSRYTKRNRNHTERSIFLAFDLPSKCSFCITESG